MIGIIIYSNSSNFFVNPDNNCKGKTPCYPKIQEAVASADHFSTIQVLAASYGEACLLDSDKTINLECGCNSTYSTQDSFSSVNSLTIEAGTMVTKNLIIGP
jgi:hypothetical protein